MTDLKNDKKGPTKNGKRIIVCCDGTWVSSIGDKGGPQSNVTRISRAFKRVCDDGKTQTIFYDSGVGSSASKVDQIMGGAFGVGLEQNIREVYNFICNNYVPRDDHYVPETGYQGDEIILLGFSRGAFTARSVADLIGTVGLLTNDGLDVFSSIFKDYENIADPSHHGILLTLTPFDHSRHREDEDYKRGWIDHRKAQFLEFLKGSKFTNEPPQILALAVFDTVGTLGIPPAPVLGIHGSAKQYKFSDTLLSHRVQNAFQALALDEPRYAFRPALWERSADSPTNLKQVWFPGNHGNIGGGWCDQQIADITLAWMVDQLESVDVQFREDVLKGEFKDGQKAKEGIFGRELGYYRTHPFPYVPPSLWAGGLGWLWYVKQRWPVPGWFGWWKGAKKWAVEEVYEGVENPRRDDHDCTHLKHEGNDRKDETPRSWALGQIRFPDSFFQCVTGSWVRTPGETVRVNPETNKDIENAWLENTGERVHSSVRVRLACGGLGVDDHEVWKCAALTGNPTNGVRWKLRRVEAPKNHCNGLKAVAKLATDADLYPVQEEDFEWSWWLDDSEEAEKKRRKDKQKVSTVKVIPEEPLAGKWERWLLKLHCGEKYGKDVWKYAREHSLEVLG